MSKYYAIFSVENPQELKDIFGEKIIDLARMNFDNKFKDFSQFLFDNYDYKEEKIKNEDFTYWSLPVNLKKEETLTDPEEQINTLEDRGKVFLRKLLINEFGGATGNKIDFNFFIEPANNINEMDKKKIDEIAEDNSQEKNIDYSKIVSKKDFLQILNEEKIQIYLQPLIKLDNNQVQGYEVLTRGPDGDLFSAPDLFSAAEYYHKTNELELLSIKKGLEWGRKIPNKYLLTLNMNPHLLFENKFYDIINNQRFLNLHNRLLLEITEHMPMFLLDSLENKFKELQKKGIKFALDDTGCGFADLDTVAKLQPYIVKLCITVINRLLDGDKVQQEVCQTINKVKERSPDSLILAEGIEKKKQIDILLNNCAVTMGQGFYFAHPRPAEKIIKENFN